VDMRTYCAAGTRGLGSMRVSKIEMQRPSIRMRAGGPNYLSHES
jgi:hypothetical protein